MGVKKLVKRRKKGELGSFVAARTPRLDASFRAPANRDDPIQLNRTQLIN